MTEYAGAGFFAGKFLQTFGDLFADAPEAYFAATIRIECDDSTSIRHACAFGHNDQGAVLALRVALLDELRNLIEVERNLRQENHICSAGDATPKRDPSGMASHHLEHHHALVACRGGMQTVEAVDHGFHGAVETESHGGGAEIIVDGLGHADDGPAFAVKLQTGGERAIAAYDHQCGDAELVDRAFGFGDDFRRHFGDVARADFCGKMPFV